MLWIPHTQAWFHPEAKSHHLLCRLTLDCWLCISLFRFHQAKPSTWGLSVTLNPVTINNRNTLLFFCFCGTIFIAWGFWGHFNKVEENGAMTLFLSRFQAVAERQFSEFLREANWSMRVSSPSILVRSCQRAAKIVQLLHLFPNAEKKGHSLLITNKPREQPSLKFRLHPELHESVTAVNQQWLISSSYWSSDTFPSAWGPMGRFSPLGLCWRNLIRSCFRPDLELSCG